MSMKIPSLDPETGQLEFPCELTIKAMGLTEPEFELVVVEMVRVHCPNLGEDAVSTRPSKGGKYQSVSVLVNAHSREQMDALYRDLTSHPKVLMAL
jgi:putative lipoic acid-binding regulatory protein